MTVEIIKIPAKRISSLLGDGGKVKKLLEKKCKIKITVNREGDVEASGEEIDVYFAQEIIKAIGRGFEPETALKLLDDDYQFYLIELREYAHTEKALERIKGRIIGERGKIKTEIEGATDSYISIYGKTVGIISRFDSIEYAKEAIYRLASGAMHISVIKYLSTVRKKLIAERLGV